MSSVYDMKLDRQLGIPELPKPTATLAEQRAAAKALRVLYPGIKITLRSIRVEGGKRVVRELEV